MEFVHFLRYFLWTGAPAALQEMRANELKRKTALKIPFDATNAFQGTQCPPTSSKSEFMMWNVLSKQIEARMRSYPIGLEDTKKTLDADSTPDGPHLTPA
jgi:hypothetical protein